MTAQLQFVLNGRAHTAREVDPHESLLSYLRRIGLTGAKEGCAEGECGACAVVWRPAGAGADAPYEAVNACLMQVAAVVGADVWTVEGITPAEGLHPVQVALAESGGSQCGYCTPGFVMSLFAQYHRARRLPVARALCGNLCRCTGYRPIRDAAEHLPDPAADDSFRSRAATPPSPHRGYCYEARSVRYDRPAELTRALELRAQHPDAHVVCGGTDIGVALNRDRLRDAHWLAVDRVRELRECQLSDGHIELGAALTLAEIEDGPAAQVPLMTDWIPLFASRLIRARATLGGNLVTASPIGDAAPLLLALDAQVELCSLRGARWLPLSEFFVGYRQTALATDELLTKVRVRTQPPSHGRFFKVSKRHLDDISSVAAGFVLDVQGGCITRARLAYGGVAATPLRALAAEAAMQGQPLTHATFATARRALEGAFHPIDDVRASAAYRDHMIRNLFDKFRAEVLP